MKFDFYVRRKSDLIAAIEEFGFVPFFRNRIEGFSVEERISPEAWFPETGEGIWEWKGPVIRECRCAYGKFFEKKAVFVSKEWFLHLANYRRGGYDYDARSDEGLANYREESLYNLIDKNAPALSTALKRKGGYGGGGKKGFDSLVSSLQSQCYVVVNDFVYNTDKFGKPYGWGVAQYTTPEKFYGKAFSETVYKNEPEESYEKIFGHIKSMLPHAGEDEIKRLIG